MKLIDREKRREEKRKEERREVKKRKKQRGDLSKTVCHSMQCNAIQF